MPEKQDDSDKPNSTNQSDDSSQSKKTDAFNEQVALAGKGQSTIAVLTGRQLPPAPGIIPRITGDTSVKDLGAIIIESLMNLNDNLEAKSRLSSREIMLFAKGMMEAVRYGPINEDGWPTPKNVLWAYCLNRLKLAVSQKGEGRHDVIKASNAVAKLESDMKAREQKEIKV